MADNTESIGGVSVSITGDASGLGPAFTAAQSQAQSAGTAIANSFNAGAAGADQITAAIERLTVALREEAAASSLAMQRNAALSSGFRQVGEAAAAGHLNVRFLLFGLKDLAEGRGAFAMAELVNVLVRIGPVALAAGASIGVLAAAFYGPIAAAKELQKEIDKVNQEVDDGLEKSLRAMENVNVKLQEMRFGSAAGSRLKGFYDDLAYQSDLDKVRVLSSALQEMARQAGTFKFTDIVPYLGSKDRADEQKAIVDKQGEIEKLLESADAKRKDIELNRQQTAQDAAQQAGALRSAQISLQEAQLAHQSALNKAYSDEEITQARDAANQRIAATVGEYDRVVATGAAEVEEAKARQRAITNAMASEIPERIRLARAAGTAEQAGKSGPEQQRIGLQTEAKVVGIQTGADKQTTDAQANVVAAQQKATVSLIELNERLASTLRSGVLAAYEDIVASAREVTKEQEKAVSLDATTRVRVLEIQSKGQGQLNEAAEQAKKIAAEREYGLVLVHTGAQQIANAQQIAAIESQARAAKLAGIQAELLDANALTGTLRDEEKIATLQQQVLLLKQQNANADAQANANIDVMNEKLTKTLSLQQQIANASAAAQNTMQSNNQQIGQAIGQAIGDLPKEIGDDIGGAIANALFERHPGESIGQAMAKALTDALKQTAASLLKSLISGGIQLGLGALGFADGTDSAPGGFSMVGEKGPEIMYVPRGAQITPNHKIGSYAGGTSGARSFSSSSSTSIGELHVHAHGVSNPDAFAKAAVAAIPREIKRQTSKASPYSN